MIHRSGSHGEDRRRRSYTPEGLFVVKGPGESYGKGSVWVLGDEHGYVQAALLRDSRAIHPDTLYIENIEVKSDRRGRGHGRALYLKAESFAENIGAEWIQIDSEAEAVGFWAEMGFRETGMLFYAGKKSMVKRIG
jgi:ribosomal protein S18 acetylase RimI-like enzyme